MRAWVRGVVVLVLYITTVCVLGLRPVRAQDTVAGLTANIVEIRDKTQAYVAIAKGSLHNQELVSAQGSYADALSKCDAWDQYVTTAIRDGKTKIPNLQKDNTYQEKSQGCSDAATKFVTFVDSKTLQGKAIAITTLLSTLGKLGFDLWTKIADRKAQQRKDAANDFAMATKWSQWADIKSN